MLGALDTRGPRQGLSFWFDNYTRSSGPVFTIRPSGLKKHKISLGFGAYAAPCINHIQARATDEDYALARLFVQKLGKSYHLSINDAQPKPDWTVTQGFNISVTRRVSNPKLPESIEDSVKLIVAPLVAATAELIGYEEYVDVQHAGTFVEETGLIDGSTFIEGQVSTSQNLKRERSLRNRLLCLSIHGEQCKICGFITSEVYGQEHPSILEVHHIEPLSELEKPRAYDPGTDLIPLCPNCHSAIHKRNPAFSPEELKEIMGI